MVIGDRVRDAVDDPLDAVHEVVHGVAAGVVLGALGRRPPDVVDHEVHQLRVQLDHALLDVGRLGQRPEPRPRQAERHRPQDHRLAPVVAHERRVPAPPRRLVHDEQLLHYVPEHV